MNLDPTLLELLVCPKCHSALTPNEAEQTLDCQDAQGDCGLRYPVRDDIPVMLIDEAIPPRLMTGPLELDDGPAIERADVDGLLPAVASAAAQVRAAATATAEADLAAIVRGGTPRALVCVGVGTAGLVGDLLAAVALARSSVPVAVHKDFGLPAWVGANDLVIAASSSGTSTETLSAVDEAIRRGAQWVGVASARSSLADRAEQSGAPLVPVPPGRPARADLWALAVPALELAAALRIAEPMDVEAIARRLELVASSCHVGRDALVNPAKSLAMGLRGRITSVWGTGPLAGVAAHRFAAGLNENAKVPAIPGVLPEAWHNQRSAFEGEFTSGAEADIFADPDLDGPPAVGLAHVLLREIDGERPETGERVAAFEALAGARGLRLHELRGEGVTALERFASIVGLLDFASVYVGLDR